MKLGQFLCVDVTRVLITCNIPAHVIPETRAAAMPYQGVYRPERLNECWSFGGGHRSVLLRKADNNNERLKILKTDDNNISVLCSYQQEVTAGAITTVPELVCVFQTSLPFVEIRRCWRFRVQPADRDAVHRVFWNDFIRLHRDPGVRPCRADNVYLGPNALPRLVNCFERVPTPPGSGSENTYYARRNNILITKLDEPGARLTVDDNDWKIELYACRETSRDVFVYYQARSSLQNAFTLDLCVVGYH